MEKNNEEANSLIVQGLSVTTYNKLVEENAKLKSKFITCYYEYSAGYGSSSSTHYASTDEAVQELGAELQSVKSELDTLETKLALRTDLCKTLLVALPIITVIVAVIIKKCVG